MCGYNKNAVKTSIDALTYLSHVRNIINDRMDAVITTNTDSPTVFLLMHNKDSKHTERCVGKTSAHWLGLFCSIKTIDGALGNFYGKLPVLLAELER